MNDKEVRGHGMILLGPIVIAIAITLLAAIGAIFFLFRSARAAVRLPAEPALAGFPGDPLLILLAGAAVGFFLALGVLAIILAPLLIFKRFDQAPALPPFPFPPGLPGLPGLDWTKLLGCVCGSLGPPGGKPPADPKQVFEWLWDQMRKGKEAIDNARRDAEEKANHIKAWVDAAGSAATDEMRKKQKQAEEEAQKMKNNSDNLAAVSGEILSQFWPSKP